MYRNPNFAPKQAVHAEGELAKNTALLAEQNRANRIARIAEIEDRVFDITTAVIEANLSFFEVEPDQVDPPEEWVALYGEKGARQRLVVAKAGHKPAAQAPSAIKLAVLVRAAITRAYSHEGGRKTLNQINVKIALPAPTSKEHPGEEYPVLDLDDQ